MTVSSIAGKHYGFTGYLGTIPQTVVMSRAVNMASITYPVTAITFDNPYTGAGAYTDVLEDMTILVYNGNTSTLKGRLRVAAGGASSTVMQVNEFSKGTLDLADNDRIDVVAEWRIWDKLIEAAAAFRRDSRITFTDQTDAYKPIANGGGCWFGFVDTGQTYATVQHDWTTSRVVDPDNTGGLEYLADVVDGTITVGADTDDTITVRYPAGFRWVTLTVTDADNGASSVKRIPVYVYDNSTYSPLKVKCENRSYSNHDSGHAFTFSVPSGSEASLTSLPDGAMIVYWETERYDGTVVSYGSSAPTERSHIKFVGFLVRDSIRISAEGDEVTFEAVSALEILNQTAALPQLMVRDSTPSKWTELKGLTVGLALAYVWYWHASIATAFDFLTIDGTEYNYKRLAIEDDSSLGAQLRDLAQAINVKLTCDRLGRLILKRDPNYGGTGDRAGNPTLYAITVSDFMELEFATEHRNSVKFVRGEGIKEHTSTGEARAIFSNWPGNAPGEGTTTETLARQVWFGQSDANERTGHHGAKLNGLFYDTTTKAITHVPQGASVTLADSYDFIDPALLQWVTLTLASTTNSRGRSFTSSTRWLVDSIDVSYSDGNVKDVRATISHETRGVPGVTYVPPQSSENGLPSIPPLDLVQPIVDPIIAPLPPYLVRGPGTMAALSTDNYIRITSAALGNGFHTPAASGGPNWFAYALTGISGNLVWAVEDAFSPGRLGTGTAINVYIVTDSATDAAWYLEDIFGARTLASLSWTPLAGASASGRGRRIESNFGATGHVVIVSNYFSDATYPGTYYTYSTDANDGSPTWATETQITAHYNTVAGANNITGLALSSRTPGTGVVGAYSATGANTSSEAKFHNLSSNFSVVTSALASPANYDPKDVASRFIHIPFDRNTTEGIVWFNRTIYSGALPGQIAYELRRKNGSSVDADCGPTKGGLTLVGWNAKSFHSCPIDRSKLIYAATSYDSSQTGVFVSADEGATWTEIDSTDDYRGVAIAGNDANVLYAWGGPNAIGYSGDFGASGIDSRKGDMTGSGEIVLIVGGLS